MKFSLVEKKSIVLYVYDIVTVLHDMCLVVCPVQVNTLSFQNHSEA